MTKRRKSTVSLGLGVMLFVKRTFMILKFVFKYIIYLTPIIIVLKGYKICFKSSNMFTYLF